MGAPDTSLMKKNVSYDRVTLVRKIKTRLQAVKSPQIHILDEEGEQCDNESYGEKMSLIGTHVCIVLVLTFKVMVSVSIH